MTLSYLARHGRLLVFIHTRCPARTLMEPVLALTLGCMCYTQWLRSSRQTLGTMLLTGTQVESPRAQNRVRGERAAFLSQASNRFLIIILAALARVLGYRTTLVVGVAVRRSAQALVLGIRSSVDRRLILTLQLARAAAFNSQRASSGMLGMMT